MYEQNWDKTKTQCMNRTGTKLKHNVCSDNNNNNEITNMCLIHCYQNNRCFGACLYSAGTRHTTRGSRTKREEEMEGGFGINAVKWTGKLEWKKFPAAGKTREAVF